MIVITLICHNRLVIIRIQLCSGQSNMQMTLEMAANTTAEINDASHYPFIRIFTVASGIASTEPLDQLLRVLQPWTVSTPASIADGSDSGSFSAL
jgi:hypothetical protein